MEEVSGPVVAIALVLSAVFLPTVFIPGITGKLYQQFAVTIAISVIISAFNALTLSPALSSLILKPKKKARGPLGAFFRGFNTMFGKATNGYVTLCGWFIRKFVISLLLLVVMTGAIGVIGKQVPGGFLPEEDQGYLYAGVQLPNAASLQRTDDVTRELEKIIMETPGRAVLHHGGRLQHALRGDEHLQRLLLHHAQALARAQEPRGEVRGHHGEPQPAHGRSIPQGVAFAFSPPAIPGIGTSGGVTFILEDRAGKDIAFLWANTQKFMAEAQEAAGDRRRDHDLPADGAADLRGRGPRQGAQAGGRSEPGLPDPAGLHGRLLRQLLQPLRPPVAGLRPGRGRIPHAGRPARPVLRAQRRRRHGAAVGPDLDRAALRARVHHALQPLPLGPDQRRRRAGLQLGAGHEGAGGGVRRQPCRARWASTTSACASRRRRPWKGCRCRSSSGSRCSSSS